VLERLGANFFKIGNFALANGLSSTASMIAIEIGALAPICLLGGHPFGQLWASNSSCEFSVVAIEAEVLRNCSVIADRYYK
jgi:hypothetical protein